MLLWIDVVCRRISQILERSVNQIRSCRYHPCFSSPINGSVHQLVLGHDHETNEWDSRFQRSNDFDAISHDIRSVPWKPTAETMRLRKNTESRWLTMCSGMISRHVPNNQTISLSNEQDNNKMSPSGSRSVTAGELCWQALMPSKLLRPRVSWGFMAFFGDSRDSLRFIPWYDIRYFRFCPTPFFLPASGSSLAGGTWSP